MSVHSEEELSVNLGQLDPYIERLRKKYLERSESSDTKFSSETTDHHTTDNEPFMPLPPNPSLTESERKHYNRAMKELGKALKLSENNLRTSIAEFERSVITSNDEDKIHSTNVEGEHFSTSFTDDMTIPNSATEQTSENLTWPTALPSTIPSESKKKESTYSTADKMTSWENETSLSRLSHQLYSNLTMESGKMSAVDVKAIYSELMNIYQKLLVEKRRITEQQVIEEKLEENFEAREKELAIREAFLLEKEKELLGRERSLSLGIQNMKKTKEIAAKLEGVELEVQERIDLLQQSHQLEIERLNSLLQEKGSEVKRVKLSFNMIKEQNDQYKGEIETMISENTKLKACNTKLSKRLENLQRRQEFRACKPTRIISENNKIDKENVAKQPSTFTRKGLDKTSSKQLVGMLETLSVAFDWLSEVHLKRRCESSPTDMTISIGGEYVIDKCLKVLPLLVDVIKILAGYSIQKKQHLSFLSFIYSCLCRVDESQNALLSSTTRRLGDELYKCQNSSNYKRASSASLILATTASTATVDSIQNFSYGDQAYDSTSENSIFFRSNNSEIRLLSCFIILKTLHQVDVLAQVFGQVKKDLKDERNRKVFLDYNATHIVLPYITYRANKALVGDAIDVVLQMSMESSFLPMFLEQCSTEQWFRAFSSIMRSGIGSLDKSSQPNTIIIEKLSIILQKLSKIKSNRKFFDAFSMGRNLQECYRACDPKNTFLVLNLRSILFNLNLLKDASQASN